MSTTRLLCLLLVEDDDLVRDTLLLMLEDEGYQVTTACSASEALAMIRDGLRVNITVTDIDLGEGPSGSELADRLHAIRPEMPVIFITGRTASLMRREWDAREAVLVKPFQSAELSRLVQRMVAARRG